MTTSRSLLSIAFLCALGVMSSGCASGGDPEATSLVQDQLRTHFGPSVDASEVDCPPISRDVAQEITCTSTVNGTPLEWTVTTRPEADGQPFGFDFYPTTESFSDLVELSAFMLSTRNLKIDLDSADCPATLDAATVGIMADCKLVADGVPFRGQMRLDPPDGIAPHPSVDLYADGAMIRPIIQNNVSQILGESTGTDVEVTCEMPLISPIEADSHFFCDLLAPEADRTGTARVSVRDLSGQFSLEHGWDAPS